MYRRSHCVHWPDGVPPPLTDEGGIVPPEEYQALRSHVLAAMCDLQDPETGEHVFAFVLSREDAPMVGWWGEYIGDLAYCYTGGYRWSD